MRYTITDEIASELHNLIGRKVTHAASGLEERAPMQTTTPSSYRICLRYSKVPRRI
jgi:hypothetical protein